MSARVAVVLFNLGGPDSLAAVRPFLYNLFSDPDIIQFPFGALLQRPLAWLIARRRAPQSAQGYAAIGGRSPINELTARQAQALSQALARDGEFEVFYAMRYWHPLIAETVSTLKAHGHERVVLLPLYPQYSRTTTGSALNEFARQCRRLDYTPRLGIVRHWYDAPDYIEAIARAIEAEAARLPDPDPAQIELLLSAHGLPRRLVERGDPYAAHVEATATAVARRLGWPQVTLCYQSRVGPLEWLRPYTEEVICEKAARGCRQMLVYPIAFVSDHIETLYELGIQYAELARSRGIAHYRVVPALNDDPLLIAALRKLVLAHLPP
jgi:ferrochelatase